MSNESLEVVSKTDNVLTPSVNYYGDKVRLRFTGNVLIKRTATYSHQKVVYLFLVHEMTDFHSISSYPTLANAPFEAAKLTKNVDVDKYKYFGFWIGFDGHGSNLHQSEGDEKNVIIFAVDMSSSTNIDNKKKDILILGKGPTKSFGEHSLSAGKMYSINFTNVNTK